jgi:hypothetical protein
MTLLMSKFKFIYSLRVHIARKNIQITNFVICPLVYTVYMTVQQVCATLLCCCSSFVTLWCRGLLAGYLQLLSAILCLYLCVSYTLTFIFVLRTLWYCNLFYGLKTVFVRRSHEVCSSMSAVWINLSDESRYCIGNFMSSCCGGSSRRCCSENIFCLAIFVSWVWLYVLCQ